MDAVIKAENLRHVYGVGTPFEHVAVDNMDFCVERGEFLGIIGHTGSGKSTLIQHLNGLLKPTSGRILVDGEDIWESKEKTRAVRFKVGLVFQYPEYQLFEETVYKDIAFGPKNMKLKEREIDERVREAADFVGIPEELFERSPFELSGGQKRRVAIAGVIAMRPEVLILDEPTAGLDPAGCANVLSNVQRYHDERGSTIILVTHSMEDAAKMVDRLVVLDDGKIAMQGKPAEVFGRGSELTKIGMAVPQVTLVALRLAEMGMPLNVPVYTVEQAKAAILARKGGGLNA